MLHVVTCCYVSRLIDGMVGIKVQRVENQIMKATENLNAIRPHLDNVTN